MGPALERRRRSTRVAVVIITRDRARELLRTLARLEALSDRPEIVVVEQASGDDTARLVRSRFPAVQLLRLDRNHGAAGRNAGARLADCPYIAFCDDDSWWADGALERGARVLDAHPSVALVAGRVLIGDEERLDPACEAMVNSPLDGRPRLPGPRVLGFVACGAIVRQAPFLAVGGFSPRLAIGAEEQLLATDLATAGWDLVYRDDVVAHHHPSRTRDRRDRLSVLERNQLWFTWLRRRLPSALRHTGRTARRAITQPASRDGLIRAVRGAGWALRNRRPVPPWLEAELQQLDRLRD
jgi:N-acetylglucosaminyl-diphospho-decaprenol L-rhamnosyltransferase